VLPQASAASNVTAKKRARLDGLLKTWVTGLRVTVMLLMLDWKGEFSHA